jgi:large subunit ribosomal protein L54
MGKRVLVMNSVSACLLLYILNPTQPKLRLTPTPSAKSKKLRRKAAKRQRKLEARLEAQGDLSSLAPKIPITQQSIDLPANEERSVDGALDAERARENLTAAMRKERRKGIKEANFLKGM